ncbi:MAG: TniQ family protein [Ensifer sp. SSB1]|nr:TniQ family protein [Ensifer sp. SSB1]
MDKDILPERPLRPHLPRLTSQEECDLTAGTIRTDGENARIANEVTSRTFLTTKRHRFCPTCLVDDEARLPGRKGSRAYARLHWSVSSIRSCVMHDCALVEVRAPLGNHPADFSANTRMLRDQRDRSLMTPTPLPASPLDRYALARLQQRPTGSSWLDMLPLEAVCRLTETTGAILRHGIRFDPLTPDGTEWSACAAEGYAITSEGPERFSDFLQSLIKASYRSSTERRPLKIFGRLAELVQSADPLSPYKAVRELMQTVSVAELPLGPGDKFLGTVRERKLHSLSSAATASGLSRVEIRAQLRKANIITSDTENFPDHKVLFPCQALDNIGRPTRCSTKEAMGRLNATGDELAALVRARLLLPVQGKRFQAIEFSDNDVERILGHIQALPLITLEEAPMTRVSSAATVSQRSIATVLKLVLDGSVRAATTGETGLAGLLVDPVECAQARSKYKLKELPWRRAMAALQVPSRTLEVLLSKGYLEGNTTGEQLDFTITTDALIRFAREYVSMREITHQLRFAYPHLAAKVAMRAHPPATPWTIAHANFYRRSEIVT